MSGNYVTNAPNRRCHRPLWLMFVDELHHPEQSRGYYVHSTNKGNGKGNGSPDILVRLCINSRFRWHDPLRKMTSEMSPILVRKGWQATAIISATDRCRPTAYSWKAAIRACLFAKGPGASRRRDAVAPSRNSADKGTRRICEVRHSCAMDEAICGHHYELSVAGARDRICFRATNVVRAIVRAEDLVEPGCSATLIENGLPVARVWADRFLVFPNYCRPVSGF